MGTISRFLEFEQIFSIGVAFVILFYVVNPYNKDLKDIPSRLTRNDSR